MQGTLLEFTTGVAGAEDLCRRLQAAESQLGHQPPNPAQDGSTGCMAPKLYRNIKYDLCLDYSELHSKGLKVLRCDMESPYQRFQFQYFIPSPPP